MLYLVLLLQQALLGPHQEQRGSPHPLKAGCSMPALTDTASVLLILHFPALKSQSPS